VQVTAFGKLAQELAGELVASDKVYVEGKLTLSTWEKDGEKRAGLS